PHPCPRPCHSAPCPPCSQTVRQRCHCKISGLYIPCIEWTSADDETKTKLTSCNNQCPKELSCGHRCRLLCHPGDCGAQCVHKVKLRCPCRRIKKVRQTPTYTVGSFGSMFHVCSRSETGNPEELEAFERRLKGAGRRNKRKRKGEESGDEGRGLWARRGLSLVLLSVGGALLAAAYFYLTTA
uniref:NF-X1-type domain-containing protein n=1 Tax=Periophthalmus magnuspinnatus TaxID=409849 RepID=A0A3B4A793_9GOBI